MTDYRIEAATKEEWAERALRAEARLATCEKYRDAYAECDSIGTQAVRDLEAKLAKAVEALEYADSEFARLGLPEDCSPRLNTRAALARITDKGEPTDG